MKLPFIKGEDFMDYLVNQKNSVQLVGNIILSYNHLLRACLMLIGKSVLHYDLKGSNILFDTDRQIPLLIDFGLSVDMSITDEKQIKKIFYVYAPSYYVWPLEVHYLSYLIHKNNEPNIDELITIAKDYVKNNKGLQRNFSGDFLDKYEKECIKQLKKYNNIPSEKRLETIIKYWVTFDNYALSIMYLKFLKYINIGGFTDNNFIIFFSKLLLQNIHPDPEKRLGLIDTVHTFNTFLYQKNLNNIQTFEDLTDNFIKNREDINEKINNDKKKYLYDTKTMKILRRQSLAS